MALSLASIASHKISELAQHPILEHLLLPNHLLPENKKNLSFFFFSIQSQFVPNHLLLAPTTAKMRPTAAVIQIFTYVPQKREPAFSKTANLRRSRRLIEKHLEPALKQRLRQILMFGGEEEQGEDVGD